MPPKTCIAPILIGGGALWSSKKFSTHVFIIILEHRRRNTHLRRHVVSSEANDKNEQIKKKLFTRRTIRGGRTKLPKANSRLQPTSVYDMMKSAYETCFFIPTESGIISYVSFARKKRKKRLGRGIRTRVLPYFQLPPTLVIINQAFSDQITSHDVCWTRPDFLTASLRSCHTFDSKNTTCLNRQPS